MEKLLGPSWRTTLLGLLGFLAIAVQVGQKLVTGEPVDYNSAVIQLSLAFGLIKAKDAKVTGGTIPFSPTDLTSPKGFARQGVVLALAVLTLTFAGCAWLKGSSVSGTVNAKDTAVTLTTPDGSTYVATVVNQTACLQAGTFTAFGRTNLECNGACAQRVAGGGTVTLYCRIQGSGASPFPFQVAVPF